MIINKGNMDNLFTGYKAAFNTGFRSAQPMYEKVATVVPSNNASEDYAWLGQFPKLREWIGDRALKDMTAQKYNIKNKRYESTVAVQREDIERDNYCIYAPLMQEMGYAAATHPDELIFALLAAGFTAECYDGQPFFDTDHPVGGVSVSNFGGGSGTPWFLLDTRRPLKPLIFQKEKDYQLLAMTDERDEAVFMRGEYRYGVDARGNVGFGFWQQAHASREALNAANFDAAIAAMIAQKSDEGRPLGIAPNLLVVGPADRAAARALIEAETLASGASNTNFKAVELFVCPWLV
ncbi:MAG: Mu-like prophage major head subunit gpT family protein [Azonexus sp.]|jgi:phage major head subunit gpT-like protein|nr:Mu-like prophage major head subunit gpT family protein [Azonexus sp.]